jgi:hypothetical protein
LLLLTAKTQIFGLDPGQGSEKQAVLMRRVGWTEASLWVVPGRGSGFLPDPDMREVVVVYNGSNAKFRKLKAF